MILVLTLFSCEKDHPPVDTAWEEGVIYFTGDIAIDGCGWLLLSEGESYHLTNLEEKYKQNGLVVWFKGADLSETFSCGRAQTQFSVKEIDEMMEKRQTQADQLLELYNGSWDGDISRVYRDFAF